LLSDSVTCQIKSVDNAFGFDTAKEYRFVACSWHSWYRSDWPPTIFSGMS